MKRFLITAAEKRRADTAVKQVNSKAFSVQYSIDKATTTAWFGVRYKAMAAGWRDARSHQQR
jgi:hypothetical protein